MNLGHIIRDSQRDRELIRKEHLVMVNFLRENSHLLKKSAYELDVLKNFDLERILKFSEHLLLDNLLKLNEQIKKNDEEDFLPFFYYKVQPGLYESQIKNGFVLGEKDDNGRLVSGSNLFITGGVLDVAKFKELLSTECN